jgi:cell division protein YceG involved in septum cleavage
MKQNNIYIIIAIIIIIIIILFIINKYYLKHKESFLTVPAHPSGSSKPSVQIKDTETKKVTTTTKKSSNESKSNSCFSKDTFLQLEDGTNIKITDAKLGNKILSCLCCITCSDCENSTSKCNLHMKYILLVALFPIRDLPLRDF